MKKGDQNNQFKRYLSGYAVTFMRTCKSHNEIKV